MIEHAETYRAVFPYCGHEHEGSWEWENDPHSCDQCGKTFSVDIRTEQTYSTEMLFKCPSCDGLVETRRATGLTKMHWVSGKICEGGKGIDQ